MGVTAPVWTTVIHLFSDSLCLLGTVDLTISTHNCGKTEWPCILKNRTISDKSLPHSMRGWAYCYWNLSLPLNVNQISLTLHVNNSSLSWEAQWGIFSRNTIFVFLPVMDGRRDKWSYLDSVLDAKFPTQIKFNIDFKNKTGSYDQ